MRLRVYRNLRRGGYSLMAAEGPQAGKVIGHANRIALEDVTFRVRQGGRQRVLRTGVKNVHAFVEGTLPQDGETRVARFEAAQEHGKAVRYNPKVAGHFHLADSPDAPLARASFVALDEHGIKAVLWERDPADCPHDTDDQEAHWMPDASESDIYIWHRCYACGREFHDPAKLRAAGYALRRGALAAA